MLDINVAKQALDYGLYLGADFSELFVEKTNKQYLKILSSKLQEIQSGIEFGIGIRLLFGTKVLYGYTNNNNIDEIMRIMKVLAVQDIKSQVRQVQNIQANKFDQKHPFKTGLQNDKAIDEKINTLLLFDHHARKTSEKIEQVEVNVAQKQTQIEIFNSEGLYAQDERNYIRFYLNSIAKDGGGQSTSAKSPGAMAGWEFIETIDPQQLATACSTAAIAKLKAIDCPAGRMPVVIENGFGGVIFHEACGHQLETTAVAKKASVFHDKMGEMIANECVSAVDEGLTTNSWGSINIDDEGMLPQKTQLIKNGKLTSFMVDKVGSLKTGYARTGSGRRESYRYAPASRMRNTIIEAGCSTTEEMIDSIEHGIYCKVLGGGSVNPATGDFNFVTVEPYLIKKGKIDSILKPASLIGNGPDILTKISMVGTNLSMDAGMCGSVSGSIPVCVGQPALKVDDILVGGQK